MHHFQNISHQEKHPSWNCVVNDEVPSTTSQRAEQIEIIQEVVLSEISMLDDSAPDKKPKDQTQFSPKKTLEKRKWIW